MNKYVFLILTILIIPIVIFKGVEILCLVTGGHMGYGSNSCVKHLVNK
ncbi:hypothetical protein KKG22_00815 [Patescibacteria group bacterium]|nr:hypothetical protein [Patescibacteria group bacterium]